MLFSANTAYKMICTENAVCFSIHGTFQAQLASCNENLAGLGDAHFLQALERLSYAAGIFYAWCLSIAMILSFADLAFNIMMEMK